MIKTIHENLNFIKVQLNEISNTNNDELFNKYKGIMITFSDIIKEIFDKSNSQNLILNTNHSKNESQTSTKSKTKTNNTNSNNITNNYSNNKQYNILFDYPDNFEYFSNNIENEKKYIQLLLYGSIEVLFMILSYGNIFISDSKKTSKITFDFFCQNIKYIVGLYNKEIIFSIFNKIFFIYKNFDNYVQQYYLKKLKELFKILEEILDINKIEKDKVIIYNKYKNKIDSFKILEKSKDITLFKSQKNISFVPIINLREDIKNFFNEPKVLINTLEELDKESKIIKEINEKNEAILFKGCCEINKQYLYIFKKIMDKIDSISANPNIVKIFFDIIFRSSIFIKYLQKSFTANSKNIISKNKEIYIEKYLKLGHYLYNIYIKTINSELLTIFNDCIINQEKKINKIIDKFCEKQEIKINDVKDKVIFSEFHSFIYKIMLSNSEFQRPFSFLAFNIKFKKEEFKLLYEEFKYYKIQPLFMDKENESFQFQSKDFEDRETIYFFENNKGYIEVCNVLGRILFNDPIIINLFIIIKIWAFNYEISNDNQKDSDKKLFDDSLILYFIYLFLIQIGEIRLFKEYIKVDINDNLSFKVDLNKLNEFNENNLLYKKDKIEKIGKLFIEFLYFILQLIETSQNLFKKKQYLMVSLNSFSFTSNNIIEEDKIRKSPKKQLELIDMRDKNNSKIFYVYTSFDLKFLKFIVTKTLNDLLDNDKIKNIFSFQLFETYNKNVK